MAVADPYAACPCGSGQKYKWCCQKIEPFAERAGRLMENGQVQAAIAALDEGLRKEPENALLLIRRAVYALQQGDVAAARGSLVRLVGKQPGHLGAQSLLTRLELQTEGPEAGAAQLQQALTAVGPEQRKDLSEVVQVVAAFLVETGLYPAAFKHLELADQLDPGSTRKPGSPLRTIESHPAISAWQKNPYRLAEAPDRLPQVKWASFAEAVAWARDGLWSSAASAFEVLTAASPAPEAQRNLGLCRLWMGDHAAAAAALRRFISQAGATTEAVDLEALCQQIAPLGPDDIVEQVQWIWPLRDSRALLEALRADPTIHEDTAAPIDPQDPDSPEVIPFALLSCRAIKAARGLSVNEIPQIVGRVLVGQEIVALEGVDDGRLDALSERFTTLAGAAIAPAHPRTKVIASLPRSTVALSCEWHFPEGLELDEVERLTREQGAAIFRERWPQTAQPYLGGRTPAAAAGAGDAEVPLRAAVFQLEHSLEPWHADVDFAAFRASLRIPSEPAIDAETVDVEQLHLARLDLVPVDRLSDDRLVAFYHRARRTNQTRALERAALVMLQRPSVASRARIEPYLLHTDLVSAVAARGQFAEAFEWIRRGRQADPVSARASNAPLWDMNEIRLKARSEPPETWVPELAVVLERYSNDPAAYEKVLLALVEMGLIRLVARPERPEEVMIDSRALQALLAEYGPRVTTASGQLGVAASRGEIWTPGSSAGGGGGGIWTPGSSQADTPGSATASSGGGKPKLIIPGR
jgi:tetratricopeptide (TPR) repeat protein